MTHDEIISDLNKYVMLVEAMGMPATAKMAAIIRSVVELHTPEQEIGGGCDENGEELWVCTHCPDGDGFQDYPCPTIQAIEKGLG
jgi:hypothetical protein